MATLERLTVFPVKGLDGIDLDSASVLDGGTLQYDREFALVDTDGDVINGKRTDRVHELATEFEPASRDVIVETSDGDERRFDLETERERVEEWFGDYFGAELTLERDESLGFVDRREMGPSLISTATLRTVASWFDEMTVEGARRRVRANVEVSGVPAFWEDRFVGDDAPALEIGDIRFEGVTPCGRCVVPQRDPDTGEPIPEFRTQFVRNRRERFPEWADEDAFDHYYTLMIIARVPESDRGKTLRVGEPVEAIE
ncbi:MOSC domain-containing protein [Natrialba asiatica]|uniref:MOSC domain-containing protein n=1 Tax=Natrialba asiatica (strain ATCC 700177 / DSM 12278 / JCM 9576 / FERM P-10747 / NBRC 102637 / 172P1) TaxID=29540 RepID=M0B6G1_NATA1|nr:MOSC N-terminal beta barrel domain-containing protein [Natrialba asiatica]ELZ06092.1 MOSC domain-containing protein [Natrialba asiatica DSM 12278]